MLSRRRFLMTALALPLPSSLHADDKGKVLRLVADEWPPYELAPGSAMDGYGVELTGIVLRQMGYQVERLPVEAPWIRVLAMISAGEADVTASALWSEERARTGRFPTEPLFDSRYAIFGSRQSSVSLKRFDDLAGKRLGIVHGYLYPEGFLQSLPATVQVITSYDAVSNLQRLYHGQLDTVLEDERTAPYLIHRHQWQDHIDDVPALYLKSNRFFALFSSRTVAQDTVDEFSRRLTAFRNSPACQELAKRYQINP